MKFPSKCATTHPSTFFRSGCGPLAKGFVLPRIIAEFSAVCLATCWNAFRDVHEASVNVLVKRKRREGLSLPARKYLRATRSVRVEIGSYFYLDHAMVLTILVIIIIIKNSFNGQHPSFLYKLGVRDGLHARWVTVVAL